MGLDKPTTTAALLRRLALPAVFVGVVIYTQFNKPVPLPPDAPLPTIGPNNQIDRSEVTTELSGPTMGTTFTVKVRGPELDGPASSALSEAVTGALDRVNEAMSTWLTTSELSRFNDSPGGRPFSMSKLTLEVLGISQAIYRASGGAFDVTVGPLVNRWGFGPEDPKGPPGADEVAKLLTIIGQDKLTLDLEEGTLTKASDGLRVDLSAVAKGYAVDQVALAVEALGHRAYMVEVGGEVRTGARGNGAPWRIAIERPALPVRGEIPRGDIFEVVELEGMSMATSGDYRNFIKDGDTLRSHTIDPRTGIPVTHGLASVTVLHTSCAQADGWATALMVLGPKEGLTIANQEGLAAMFISRVHGELVRSATDGFAPFSKPIETNPVD